RNLLYGILALQMDFLSREQLIAGMQAWALNKDQSLARILLAQGVLAEEDRAALDVLVERHLARHGHDAARSLAALPATPDLAGALVQVADADVDASLVGLLTEDGGSPALPAEVRA